jgi:hypothetical protein
MNPDESQNSAWILDYTLDNKTTVKFPEKGMILNLINKTRMGSTDVGEEFVRYISRYGIRFDRID